MKVHAFSNIRERLPFTVGSSILLEIYLYCFILSLLLNAMNTLLKVMIAHHKKLYDATIIFNILDLIFILEKVKSCNFLIFIKYN